MFGGSRFQAVLHYYSDFTKLTSPPIRDFISSYSKQKSSIKDLISLLNCFYEAQDLSLSNLINFRTIILYSLLSPVDYLAIGYYITSLLSVPSSDTSNVQLKIAGEIDDHRLRLLLLELSKYRTISGCAARLEIEIVFSIKATNTEKISLIASFLEQSSALSMLLIQHTDSETATEVFPSFAKALQSNSYLTSLTIMYEGPAYEHTSDEDFQVVKNMFEINNSITQFSLSGTGGFACCIFQGLQHNKNLTDLNLSDTGLVATEDTAQALTTMLQVNKTLAHLDLSNNWEFQNASCVFQGLQNNTTLVYLNLSNIKLEVKKDTPLAKALTTMLQEKQHLKHLDLSYNPLYDEGVYCLCEGLQHNTTLVYLNLSCTGTTDKGGEYIAQAYNSNRSLQLSLDFSYNPIRDYIKIKDSWMNDTLKLIYQ